MATLLTTDRITRIEAQIARCEAMRDALDATILSVSGRTLKEYRMDTGEGSQRGEVQDIQHLLDQYSFLESRIEHLYAKLAGRGVTNMRMRRFPSAGGRI